MGAVFSSFVGVCSWVATYSGNNSLVIRELGGDLAKVVALG